MHSATSTVVLLVWMLSVAAIGCRSSSDAGSVMCHAQLSTDPPPDAGEIWSIRRLTRDELTHTFEVLVHGVPRSLSRLPQDEAELEASAPTTSSFEVDVYRQVAREAADLGVPALLDRWGCRSDGCVQRAVARWLERAYRGPLSPQERDAQLALFSGRSDPRPVLHELLQLVFQSPRFLYVIERGIPRADGEETRDLNPFELAARLSYYLWSEPPDEALLDEARSGRIADPLVRREQALRLLADPKAARTLGRSLQRWAAPELEMLAKASSVYPEFTPELRASMSAQFANFAAMALAENLGLPDLLQTNYAPVDANLASLLGLPVRKASSADTWIAELPPPRFGVLTLPGVLTANARSDDSSPVQRGLLIRQAVLCQPVPPPPPGVATLSASGGSGASLRERFEEHTRNPACAGCHRLMDPLGFPFEIFDGLGRLRAEQVEPTSGRLDGVKSPVTFSDLPGLVDALIDAPEVSRCWTEQWLRRALPARGSADGALLDTLATRVHEGMALGDLILEIVTSPDFGQVQRRSP